jgi:transcriptional regulator with XRE-family HTH domain
MPRKLVAPKKTKSCKGKKLDVFFENVRSKRLELRLTQTDLAGRLGIHQTRISELEGGAFVETPSKLVALCRALETDPNHLFGFGKERGKRDA